MAALPTDIITEILSRLPVKSLARFKCVCKFWNSLMKTPNFIKLHLNQTLISNSDRHLLLCYKSLHSAELDHNNISFSEVQLPLSTQEFKLFGSCNGIICIANKTDVLLFNPLTKSHFQVPIPKPNRVTRYVERFMLGFGYDSKSDDYKVLKLSYSDDMDQKSVEAKLYSRNNNSWKSVQGIYGFVLDTDWPVGALVNEALHFLVCSQKTEYIIASFDLQTESFLFIDYSKLVDDTDDSEVYMTTQEVKELGGCVSAFINYYLPTEEDLYFRKGDIWVMKEYGNNESWVRLFSIGNECIPKLFGIMPIVYSKDGKTILLDICIQKFGWYDLESKKFKAIKPHGLPKRPLTMGYYVGCFLGSLVSIEDKLQSERENLPMIKKKECCLF